MSSKAIAAIGLSLALLLSGCAQGAEPEVGQELATIETQDPGYGEMTAEVEMEAPTEQVNQPEPEVAAESEETEDSAQASASTATASPSASPSPTATRSAAAAPSATASPSASPTASPTETQAPSPEPDPGFTLAEVATRNTASNCWVAIRGNVYDLTRWISEHPGGPGAITQLCGKDATSQFQGQHGGQSRPLSALAGFLVGPLRN
jgi:cytochrome b involved in lipid metabolism